MKRIRSTVNYSVPSWNYCNLDKLDIDGVVSTETCRFCIKSKGSTNCMLYNKSLIVTGQLISKTRECCKATAGFASVIDEPTAPEVQPKEIIKQTIELYSKTLNDLIAQGYPRQIAEQVAKKHLLGG